MKPDDAALDELMSSIAFGIEHDADPLTMFNGDNIDEARAAALTAAVGRAAEHVEDGILSRYIDVAMLDVELREVITVCVVWLVQTTEQTTDEVIDHIKCVVPTSKPFSKDIQGRPLARLVSCLGKIVDRMPSTDSHLGPRNMLVALAAQSALWMLEVWSGQQP